MLDRSIRYAGGLAGPAEQVAFAVGNAQIVAGARFFFGLQTRRDRYAPQIVASAQSIESVAAARACGECPWSTLRQALESQAAHSFFSETCACVPAKPWYAVRIPSSRSPSRNV